mgnify:CR=1 FL=1
MRMMCNTAGVSATPEILAFHLSAQTGFPKWPDLFGLRMQTRILRIIASWGASLYADTPRRPFKYRRPKAQEAWYIRPVDIGFLRVNEFPLRKFYTMTTFFQPFLLRYELFG